MEQGRDPVNFRVHVDRSRGWAGSTEALARGVAFAHGRKLTALELARELQQRSTVEEIDQFVMDLNGFFALIRRLPSGLVAYVDRVRTIPLFFAGNGSLVFVSDDAEWIRVQVGERQCDPIAVKEFRLTGYVTGADTLYPKVKQVLPGHRLWVGDRATALRQDSYFRFWHDESGTADVNQLYRRLESAIEEAMSRLVRFADGRQLVVPLSGGYDSRLVAIFLKRTGYKNVLTFSYGFPGNWESERSRRVASALGFEWVFVDYTRSRWRTWATSADFKRYLQVAGNWTSLPHIQDWPAVKVLKESGKVLPDAVFVPGHSGDFISSSHVPAQLREASAVSQDEMVRWIIARFYNQVISSRIGRELRRHFAPRIVERLGVPEAMSADVASNLFDLWGWREQQAKFILNAVRVYEYWGYNWWCPLWDLDVVRFWQTVPLKVRTASFYRDFVRQQWQHVVGDTAAPTGDHPQQIARRRAGVFAERLAHTPWVKRLVRVVDYYKNPLGLSGQWPQVQAVSMLLRGYNSNGMAAERFLREIVANHAASEY